jgi:competence protein ComEC
MVKSRMISPVVSAAAGSSLGFYCLGRLYSLGLMGINGLLLLLLVPVAIICFLRVLVSFPLPCGDDDKAGASAKIRITRLVSMNGLAFAFGIALGLGAQSTANSAFSLGLPQEKISGLSGVLLEDPRVVSGGRGMASLSLAEVSANGGLRVSAKGEVPVFFPPEHTDRLREFGRGSRVFAEGNFRTGPMGLSFTADSLHVTKRAPHIERFRTALRNGLIGRFSRGGEAWGGLALALLLGIRDNLESGLAGLYRDAGCSYVLALSGMHLAIIASLIALLLKKPLGRRMAAFTGIFIIAAYCLLVGPLPSLNRAALMYFLGVIALLGFLKRDAFSLLCMAFLVQITATPKAGFSLSFILSYLALAGILSVGQAIAKLLRGKIPNCVLSPLSASLGAFILTAGITAYYFGGLRPVGIVTGLVLVPLTTVFMIGSIAWLAIDFISPLVSGFMSQPLSILYRLMEKTVTIAAYLPGIETKRPLAVLALSLALTVFIMWFSSRQEAWKNKLPAFG